MSVKRFVLLVLGTLITVPQARADDVATSIPSCRLATESALLDAVDFAAHAALDGVNRDVETVPWGGIGEPMFVIVRGPLGPAIDINGRGPSTTARVPPWMIAADVSLPSSLPSGDDIFGTTASDAIASRAAANPGPPIRVLIVTDAAETQVDSTTGCIVQPIGPLGDPDRLTIAEGCRSEGHTILCSSSLVDELTRNDRQGAELVFLLAHELAHIRHGDSGAFAPAYSSVDLSSEIGRKFELMRSGCNSLRRQDKERHADEVASHALADFLLRFVMRSRVLRTHELLVAAMQGERGRLCIAVGERFENLTKLVSGFRAWRATLGGSAPTSIASDARQVLCGKSGVAYYPRLDSHPSVSARMANIVEGTENALRSMADAKEAERTREWNSRQPTQFDYDYSDTLDTSLSPPADPALTIRFGNAPDPEASAYRPRGFRLIQRDLTPPPPPPGERFTGCLPPSGSTRTFLKMLITSGEAAEQVQKEATEIVRDLDRDDTTEEGFCRSFDTIKDSDPAEVCATWSR